MKSKSAMAMGQVVDVLLDAGFIPDGKTHEEIVRLPTLNNPPLGQSGGELAKFGGRRRFARPGTTIRATVGPRTTFLYRIGSKSTEGIRAILRTSTTNIEEIKAAVSAL